MAAATLVAGMGVTSSAGSAAVPRAAAPAAARFGPLSGTGSYVGQKDQWISCGSPTACLAVGNTGGAREEASAVALEGTRWKTVSVPVPKKGQILYHLDGVFCKTAAYCLVTGGYVSRQTDSTVPYLLSWNGTSLALIPAPPVPGGDALYSIDAVSCVVAKSCVVFGTATDAHGDQVECAWTWNGSKWAVHGTAFPAGLQNPVVNVADCFSLTSCEVIGAVATNGLMFAAWNGRKFTLQRAAVPASLTDNSSIWVTSISCVSPRNCAAVDGTHDFVWNGKKWTATVWTEPKPFNLSGVSCMTATSCLAVGYTYVESVETGGAMSLTWNGSKWRTAGVPGVGRGLTTYFYGVSCPTADRCVAIGAYTNFANGRIWTLAGYWNGKSWKLGGA
jgi:hypothetical protein